MLGVLGKIFFLKLLMHTLPLKKRRIRPNHAPWVTPDLNKLMWERDRLKRIAVTSNDEIAWSNFWLVKNQLNYQIKQIKSLGSPLVDGIFLVQKMCIYSCVTLSTTLLIRAVQFNARSACDASMFTSCIYIFLRLANKCLNCTRSPEEMVQKLHKYD